MSNDKELKAIIHEVIWQYCYGKGETDALFNYKDIGDAAKEITELYFQSESFEQKPSDEDINNAATNYVDELTSQNEFTRQLVFNAYKSGATEMPQPEKPIEKGETLTESEQGELAYLTERLQNDSARMTQEEWSNLAELRDKGAIIQVYDENYLKKCRDKAILHIEDIKDVLKDAAQSKQKEQEKKTEEEIQHGIPFKCPVCGEAIQYGLSETSRKLFATSRLFANHSQPEKPRELTDEDIEKIADTMNFGSGYIGTANKFNWTFGAKWYRDQLSPKANK